jgi:hypothetical protein
MRASAAMRRAFLFLAAAAISAVVSDCVIENAAQLGLYGQSFAEHDQRSAICTLTAGVVLVLAAALIALLERLRIRQTVVPDHDWVADAAHHIATKVSWRALAPTLGAALLVRYAMESSEVLSNTGHLAVGLGWLGGPLVVALAVHAVCCALALLGLTALMRSLDDAMHLLVATIIALLAALDTLLVRKSVAVRGDRRRAAHRSSPLARALGERGPPSLVAA